MKFEGKKRSDDPRQTGLSFFRQGQGPQYTVRLWEYGLTGWLESCPQLATTSTPQMTRLAFISIGIIRYH